MPLVGGKASPSKAPRAPPALFLSTWARNIRATVLGCSLHVLQGLFSVTRVATLEFWIRASRKKRVSEHWLLVAMATTFCGPDDQHLGRAGPGRLRRCRRPTRAACNDCSSNRSRTSFAQKKVVAARTAKTSPIDGRRNVSSKPTATNPSAEMLRFPAGVRPYI
jgi:hypothetical protein